MQSDPHRPTGQPDLVRLRDTQTTGKDAALPLNPRLRSSMPSPSQRHHPPRIGGSRFGPRCPTRTSKSNRCVRYPRLRG